MSKEAIALKLTEIYVNNHNKNCLNNTYTRQEIGEIYSEYLNFLGYKEGLTFYNGGGI